MVLTSPYQDHSDGHTATNVYRGQAGIYIIEDPEEDALGLPSGGYDIPLAIQDKAYQENGDLMSLSEDCDNFFGMSLR